MNQDLPVLVQDLISYTDCQCTYFAPTDDDEKIMACYHKELEESKKSGDFVPVIVVLNDILLESIMLSADAEDANGEIDLATLKAYRQKLLQSPCDNGAIVIADLWNSLKEQLTDEVMHRFVHDAPTGEEPQDCFYSIWNPSTEKTKHLVVARVPVSEPYRVFAYLGMGGFNNCPSNAQLMAVSRYWQDKYGAKVAVISASTIEYVLDKPVEHKNSLDLALEHAAFDFDLFESSDINAQGQSQFVEQSKVWLFWWD